MLRDMLKANRFSGHVTINEAPEFKSTAKVEVALGLAGSVPAVPEQRDGEGKIIVVGQAERDIWSAELSGLNAANGAGPNGPIVVRSSAGPHVAKAMLIEALKKIIVELESTSVGG